jgi:hypothetical protein
MAGDLGILQGRQEIRHGVLCKRRGDGGDITTDAKVSKQVNRNRNKQHNTLKNSRV